MPCRASPAGTNRHRQSGFFFLKTLQVTNEFIGILFQKWSDTEGRRYCGRNRSEIELTKLLRGTGTTKRITIALYKELYTTLAAVRFPSKFHRLFVNLVCKTRRAALPLELEYAFEPDKKQGTYNY